MRWLRAHIYTLPPFPIVKPSVCYKRGNGFKGCSLWGQKSLGIGWKDDCLFWVGMGWPHIQSFLTEIPPWRKPVVMPITFTHQRNSSSSNTSFMNHLFHNMTLNLMEHHPPQQASISTNISCTSKSLFDNPFPLHLYNFQQVISYLYYVCLVSTLCVWYI